MKNSLIVLVLLFTSQVFKTQAQDYQDNSNAITTGALLGYMQCETYYLSGFGSGFNVGYQASFWKNRVRFNPNFSSMGFRTLWITDIPEQFFRNSALNLDLQLTIIRYKPISLFIGSGILGSYTRGIIGTGGMDETRTRSETFDFLRVGMPLNVGLRWAPLKSRFALQITPIDANIGLAKDLKSSDYVIGGVSARLEIHAKK